MPSAATIQTRLTQVSAAISAIYLTGQSVTVDGQTLTRANLADLERSESALEAQLKRASNPMGTAVVEFDDAGPRGRSS